MLPISPDNIFETITLPGNNGKVKAKVKKLNNPAEYDYEIWFTIEDPDGDTKSFIIDPRLKASSTNSYMKFLTVIINALPIDGGLKQRLLEVIDDFNN